MKLKLLPFKLCGNLLTFTVSGVWYQAKNHFHVPTLPVLELNFMHLIHGKAVRVYMVYKTGNSQGGSLI